MVTDEEWEGLAVEGRIVHCVDLCGVLAYLCAPLEITVYMYMSVPSPLSWGRSSFTGFSPPMCMHLLLLQYVLYAMLDSGQLQYCIR